MGIFQGIKTTSQRKKITVKVMKDQDPSVVLMVDNEMVLGLSQSLDGPKGPEKGNVGLVDAAGNVYEIKPQELIKNIASMVDTFTKSQDKPKEVKTPLTDEILVEVSSLS